MGFEPRAAVRDPAVGHGVGFAEAEARKVLYELPDARGVSLRDALCLTACEEAARRLAPLHLVALGEGAPQEVCLCEAHACEERRCLHDVLLVEHHAVSVEEDLGQAWVRWGGLLEAVGAANVGVLHPRSSGPWADQRDGLDHGVHGGEVPSLVWAAELLQQMAHAR